jgi:hypothetical protein
VSEVIDFDLVVPLHVPRTLIGPEPQPEDAGLVWRLRGWEIGCLPGPGGTRVWSWLWANGLGERVVSVQHDITVWRYRDGRREIGYMRREYFDRRKQPHVVVPTLMPLRTRPPVLARRAIPYFDKLQAALNAGHQGQDVHQVEGPHPPGCPVCSRLRGELVGWPCPAVLRWMPKWLRQYWTGHVAETLAEKQAATLG